MRTDRIRAQDIEKPRYPSRAQFGRWMQAVRENGINPTSVDIHPDGTMRFSTSPSGEGRPSDFDVWNQAGKL